MKNQDFEINQELLALSSKGDYTAVYKDDTTGYLAILLKNNKADKDYYKRNYYIIQGEYRKDALNNYFNTWITEEIRKAKVRKWFSMKDVYKGNY
jgi:hypothetical protein